MEHIFLFAQRDSTGDKLSCIKSLEPLSELTLSKLKTLADTVGKSLSACDFTYKYQTKQYCCVEADYEYNKLQILYGEVYLRFKLDEPITLEDILASLFNEIQNNFSELCSRIKYNTYNSLTSDDALLENMRSYLDARDLYEKLLAAKSAPSRPTTYFD